MIRAIFVSADDDLRAVAARVLAAAGVDAAVAAHGGRAALACLGAPPFDVLVVEQQMPDGSGDALAARLRRYCPDLQVVRMCDAADAGAGDAIPLVRPFTADDLVDAILQAAAARVAAV
jgi:CheY-like chemotaxis protein